MKSTQNKSIFPSSFLLLGTILLVLISGLGIRLYDLTDPPFDFHPTRQWRSALIARGMYFQNNQDVPEWKREQAVAQWHREAIIEPPVMEWLTAMGYQIAGGENLWIARFLSAFFWTLGGVAVFFLGRELGSKDGGMMALIYFLFLPFGIYASRAFQPDPLMVSLIMWALWAAYRWHKKRTYPTAILAGALAGLAILVKSVAIFMLGGALAGLVLFGTDLRKGIKDGQIWTLVIFTVFPTGFYFLYGLWIKGFLVQQLSFRFFPEMWRDPAFYIRWVEMSTNIVGFGVMIASLLGLLLLRTRADLGMLGGLWVGYFLYSMTFPYHTITHDYYQMPLIGIVAISLSTTLGTLMRKLMKLERDLLNRMSIGAIVIFAVAFKTWDVRVNLARKDYRGDAAEWAELGSYFKPGDSVVAITHAYGYPLAYYGWVDVDLWLSTQDAQLRELAGISEEKIQEKRLEALSGKDYFLVTRFNELDEQPDLKENLYSNYEVYAEGEGFIIFDLKKHLDSQQ